MDKSCAFRPAGSNAIAKVYPSVTVSISPLDNKVAKPCGVARDEVEKRIDVNKAEEAKGRKHKDEEGTVGRKGECLGIDEDPGEEATMVEGQ